MVARHALLRARRLARAGARGACRARPQDFRAAAMGRGRADCDRPGPASLRRQRSAPPGRRRRRVLTERAAMHFSPLVGRVTGRGSAAWDVHVEARRRQQAGEDVIFLTVGDPDQEPPAAVIEAMIGAARDGRTGYSPTIGYPALREAISARVARRSGQPCAADNIAVVPGAQGGLYCAMQCLAGPGDEGVVGEPIYATYAAVIGASGARMVTFPLRPENGFHPDLDALARAITPQTRIIWINSPHNPTGAVFTRVEVDNIAALCREHDLWLLSDEVY